MAGRSPVIDPRHLEHSIRVGRPSTFPPIIFSVEEYMSFARSRLPLVSVAVLGLLGISCLGVKEIRLPETGATLEGTVTHNGQKVEYATILVTTQSGSATGRIGEDGKYVVNNVPLGEVKVGVNTAAARGDFQSKIMSQNAAAADPSKSKRISAPKFVDVPAKYFDPEKSGITTTVAKGTNTFDIVLK
jgi:hypothetical protein